MAVTKKVGITIPLSHFVAYLNEVKTKERTWPNLDEKKWLVENFRFDNESAAYDPQPEPVPFFQHLIPTQ